MCAALFSASRGDPCGLYYWNAWFLYRVASCPDPPPVDLAGCVRYQAISFSLDVLLLEDQADQLSTDPGRPSPQAAPGAVSPRPAGHHRRQPISRTRALPPEPCVDHPAITRIRPLPSISARPCCAIRRRRTAHDAAGRAAQGPEGIRGSRVRRGLEDTSRKWPERPHTPNPRFPFSPHSPRNPDLPIAPPISKPRYPLPKSHTSPHRLAKRYPRRK